MKHDPALAAKLYARQPDIDSMRARLPDLGEGLHNAAIDLARDCTLERIDQFIARLKSATTTAVHMRQAKAQEAKGNT